jgi:hypothetical protein
MGSGLSPFLSFLMAFPSRWQGNRTAGSSSSGRRNNDALKRISSSHTRCQEQELRFSLPLRSNKQNNDDDGMVAPGCFFLDDLSSSVVGFFAPPSFYTTHGRDDDKDHNSKERLVAVGRPQQAKRGCWRKQCERTSFPSDGRRSTAFSCTFRVTGIERFVPHHPRKLLGPKKTSRQSSLVRSLALFTKATTHSLSWCVGCPSRRPRSQQRLALWCRASFISPASALAISKIKTGASVRPGPGVGTNKSSPPRSTPTTGRTARNLLENFFTRDQGFSGRDHSAHPPHWGPMGDIQGQKQINMR